MPYWVLGLFLLWVVAGIWTSITPGPDPQMAAYAAPAVLPASGSGAARLASADAEPVPTALPTAVPTIPAATDTLMAFYATPSPTAQPTPTPKLTVRAGQVAQGSATWYGKTAASGVNLRAEPTTQSTELRINRIDTPLTVLAATFNSIGEEWYKVLYGEFEGYIRSDLVTIISQGDYETLISLK